MKAKTLKDENVSLQEKLLFKSGSDAVNPQGKEALKSLAKVLNNTKDITVMIEGLTDKVPIKTKQFADNWHLSTARATTEINLTVTLVETSAKNTPLAVINMPEMKNEQELFHYGEAYDTGLRISTCYERSGENLGKFLVKNVFR